MFNVFHNHTQIGKFQTYDGASRQVHRDKDKFPDMHELSIGEMGEGYHSDRIVKLWKWNGHRKCFQRWDIERDTWHIGRF